VIDADPTRIQQALMNLALNARDAMPNGGELRITVEAIDVDGGERPLAELEPGPWIRLTISDTGVGIPEEILPHIYEPFFTTKAPGEGSGLGLAQVYGIIKQHDGHIDVDTQLGRGAAFTLYLPAVDMSDPAAPVNAPGDFPRGNRERILLVEDDHPTLIAIRDTLRSLNYAPIAAPSGEAALEIIIQRGDEIDLIISDAVMPQMSGGELLQIVRRRGMDVPFLILSGHTLQASEKEMLLAQGLDEWIAKPPSLHQLAQTIQSHLKKG
jgi:CheY-like chemotaxis protein